MDSKARQLIIWTATNADEAKKIDGNELIGQIVKLWELPEDQVKQLATMAREGKIKLNEPSPAEEEETPDVPTVG